MQYFLDFLVPKLAFFSLSAFSVLAICGLRYPEVSPSTPFHWPIPHPA